MSVGGNADQPLEDLVGGRIRSIRAMKKRLFLDLDPFHLVVHFLLNGSYRVNERRDLDERLALECGRDSLNLYSCSVQVLEDGEEELTGYDRPQADVLAEAVDGRRAIETLLTDDRPVADILRDQAVFGGVGNLIKNAVLWAVSLHTLVPGAALDRSTAEELPDQAVRYARYWYRQKKNEGELGMQGYRGEACPACESALERKEFGEYARITDWCPVCQPE